MATQYSKIIQLLLSFLVLLYSHQVTAFDLFNILTDNIQVSQSGYFTTTETLSPEEALQQTFHPTPKEAIIIGLKPKTYWFLVQLQIDESIEDRLYLEYRNNIVKSIEVYQLEDNRLVSQGVQGYQLTDSMPYRFSLKKSSQPVTYLININPMLADFIALNIGNIEVINEQTYLKNIIIIITTSAVLMLLIYNLFIFIYLNEKRYFYYFIYISGFLSLSLVIKGYLQIPGLDFFLTLKILLFVELTGLVFFTINIIDLHSNNSIIKKYLLFMLLFVIITLPLFETKFNFLMFFSMILLRSSLFFIGIYSVINKNRVSLYYLIATGGAMVLISIWLLVIVFDRLYMNIWIDSLTNIALVWDSLFLSFALAYYFREMQQKQLTTERMLFLSSRQKHIGELNSNIAHQWRQPLAELGAIMANLEAKLKYAEQAPTKDDIIKDVKQSTQILKHLSNTITTFQSFFQNNKTTTLFSVNEALTKTVNFVKDSLNDNKIVIDLNTQYDFFIEGDANALSQAILSIIMNAKDALLTREVTNPYISIVLRKQDHTIIIDIADNAGGIVITPIESVFDSYITDKEHGIGIGLFITKSIVENGFNGQVSAKNNKQGAVFTISMPAV